MLLQIWLPLSINILMIDGWGQLIAKVLGVALSFWYSFIYSG